MAELDRILDKLDALDTKVTDLTIKVHRNNAIKDMVEENARQIGSLDKNLREHCTKAEAEKRTVDKIAKKSGNKYSYAMMGVMAFIAFAALVVSALALFVK